MDGSSLCLPAGVLGWEELGMLAGWGEGGSGFPSQSRPLRLRTATKTQKGLEKRNSEF